MRNFPRYVQFASRKDVRHPSQAPATDSDDGPWSSSADSFGDDDDDNVVIAHDIKPNVTTRDGTSPYGRSASVPPCTLSLGSGRSKSQTTLPAVLSANRCLVKSYRRRCHGTAERPQSSDLQMPSSVSSCVSFRSVESLDFESSDNESMDIDDGQDLSHVNGDMVRPFDMELLRHSIQTGSQGLDQVKGKDVVLIIGKTGTGKSTLVQGLAGKQLKPVVHTTDYNGQLVKKQVFDAEDPLHGFDIGHAKTSKTKAICSYERQVTSTRIATTNGLDNKGLVPPRTILYLDSPGFEDTNGHEIDIATSVMLSQVAKQCKSLRFCILIHYASLLEDRGGAIRAILKFTKNFVKDFDREKQSFIFLFTHTNEMKIMSDSQNCSMDQCRTYLSEEIVRTLKETTDDDVKAVLEFMRKCLKRRFPLVDILHPLKTNFVELRHTLETKVKTVKHPTLALNCGLTMASKSKLDGEVLSLILRLRYLLSQPDVDTEKINKIRETFCYLGKYMEVTNIQEAVSTCEKLVDSYCVSQNNLIDQEIKRGIDSSQAFSSKNVQSMSVAVRQLLDLDPLLTEEHFHARLSLEVGDHYKKLIEKPCVKLRSAILQLDKLQAWKEVFQNFGSLYQTFFVKLKNVIHDHHNVASKLDTSELENQSDGDIVSLVKSLAALESLVAHQQLLSRHGLSLDEAMGSFYLAKEKIGSIVFSWKDAESTMMDIDKMDDATLQSLASRAKCLWVFSIQLEEMAVCRDLIKPMRAALSNAEKRLVSHFHDSSKELTNMNLPLNADAIQSLQTLKQASYYFGEIKGERWREIKFFYTHTLSNIRSILTVKSRELDDNTEFVRLNSLMDGKSHGVSLVSFDSCIVLDDFFDPQDRFVKCCSIKYHHVYNKRIEQVTTYARELFDSLYKPSTDSVQVLNNLGISLQEINQISEFVSAIGGQRWSSVISNTQEQMRLYTETLSGRKDDALLQWTDAVDKCDDPNKINLSTKRLNRLLCKLDCLLPLDPSNQAACLKADITNTLMAHNGNMMEKISDTGDYSVLLQLLTCAEAFGDFHETKEHLPKLATMKGIVLSTVSKNAQKIEDMVSRTAEWDLIDMELENFKKAANVDHFIGGQAASRLGPLLKLREQKEDDVDKHIESMIAQEDYKCIGELMSPLAESTDQMKRQKFTRYQRKICSSLNSRVEEIERVLKSTVSAEGAENVARGIQKLIDARTEIGHHLKAHLKLRPKITKLKQVVNAMFMEILNNTKEAYESVDFVNIITYRHRVEIFCNHLEPYLLPESKDRRERILVCCKKTMDIVPDIAEKFVNSNFVDAAQLLGTLSSLSKCLECNDAFMSQLVTLYRATSADLLEKINRRLRSLNSWTCETKYYDYGIRILGTLVRQLQGGLQSHIKETTLEFNCQEKLESWKVEKKAHAKEMEFGIQDAEQKLQSWSEKLDTLKSPSIISTAKKYFFGGSTYEKEQQRLQDKIQCICDDAKNALQTRDFKLLQECINLLLLVKNKVIKHVRQIPVTKLKEDTTNAFITLTDQMEHTLEEGRLSQFEGHFVDFKGFLIHIPHLLRLGKVKKIFALINQLVYEVLSKQIGQIKSLASVEENSFDFLALKSKVEEARSFGGFVADNFTLLHEQLKSSDHGYEEQWLTKISEVSYKYFNTGRDLSLLRYYAVIDVIPSSSVHEIKTAYHTKAKETHPDKRKSCISEETANDEFRKVKEAQDILLKATEANKGCHSRPFDSIIYKLEQLLREKVREYLNEQAYVSINELMFNLPGLAEMEHTVTPPLDSQKISNGIIAAVKSHIVKVKIEVDSNWSERNYRLLNDNIVDLKLMELQFKSHTNIFPTSWNTGIIQTVETQIDTLGKKARKFLVNKRTAKENEDEFRRCFIEMGSVLVELPAFKNYTKRTMCDVLEASLNSEWGYSYLFELGLSLQRGEDDQSDDDIRIAHMILAEFSHFKEVMTMAWNTETTQKPVEDTVMGINGQDLLCNNTLPINREALLKSFEDFESMYKKLLGEYIRPNTDLAPMIEKTQLVCEGLKPIPCDGGWGEAMKQKIPIILAGVFALFTVCKSGESYNKIGDSDEAAKLGDKILMKPHNIQILTLLYMFGCGNPSCSSLESQLLQIRTGEGKSMILGAAAAVLGLLGYRVRCVCYSDYLSNRDFALFKDVFLSFGLGESVKYSKITGLSEDTTAAKGDIRGLTDSLLHGHIQHNKSDITSTSKNPNPNPTHEEAISRRMWSSAPQQQGATTRARSSSSQHGSTTRRSCSSNLEAKDVAITCMNRQQSDNLKHTSSKSLTHQLDTTEEILLVDEVDVFFGGDFYGQTYNQVSQLREKEVAEILRTIWEAHKQGGRRQRLADVKRLNAYNCLVNKVKGFEYLVDNEIALMLDQVRRVDEEPYFLNSDDCIGYRVMDSVSFNVTYGYRTVFAYLKESDSGNLKYNDQTLEKVLCMNVSCGQFSYANIHPTKILGVSGTLEAMGDFERTVLSKYGIEKFLFMPSVYGKSNFEFEKVGEGLLIESGKSDFYHRLSSEITNLRKKKRAVIVFFQDAVRLNEFEKSPFYRKLGRQKSKLSEDMDADEKDFVIKQAATAGQLTICPAVFGRGTDFFCKDQKVLENGGVHIIQTFLSVEKSEEIQIQGRTARQGKKGTYQMILLDLDLKEFGLTIDEKEALPKHKWYEWLCKAREKRYTTYCSKIETNLVEATARDTSTHRYFDALLKADHLIAQKLFKDIYLTMKKRPMPSNIDIDLCLIIDVTGSMGPYMGAAQRTLISMIEGNTSIAAKLQTAFPDIDFKLRVAIMAHRDVDDKENQYKESVWKDGSHFTESVSHATQFLENATKNPSGGFDLAEDHLGAIDKCCNWTDWTSSVKFMMLLTDAPSHGMVPAGSAHVANADSYSVRHPQGLTVETIVDGLMSKEIDLFLCSFNPQATVATEERLSQIYLSHPDNTEEREITTIHMIEAQNCQPGLAELSSGYGQHIVFVLDQSGSMSHVWSGVVAAYKNYIHRRIQNQNLSDLISVVQFDGGSTITVQNEPIGSAPMSLSYSGGGTTYSPAAADARSVALGTPSSHVPLVVFMSDGQTGDRDATQAAQIFSSLNQEIYTRQGHNLELHVIAFGAGLDTRQLQQIAHASPQGQIHTSADTAELSTIFVDIAKSSQDISKVLEAEIGRRIGDAVSDKLSMEYFG